MLGGQFAATVWPAYAPARRPPCAAGAAAPYTWGRGDTYSKGSDPHLDEPNLQKVRHRPLERLARARLALPRSQRAAGRERGN